jgi:hypothetical protein
MNPPRVMHERPDSQSGVGASGVPGTGIAQLAETLDNLPGWLPALWGVLFLQYVLRRRVTKL